MTDIAVHVGKDGYPDGGYATVYGECDPKKGWYEVTMDPLMELGMVANYKIDNGRLVLRDSGKTNFEISQKAVESIKEVIVQQQQVSLGTAAFQNAMVQSAAQSQQVSKDVANFMNTQAQLVVGLQAQITALKKQVDTLKEDNK